MNTNKARIRKKRRRIARILKAARSRRLFKPWQTPPAEVLFEIEVLLKEHKVM